jgi:trimeric autotransporter adhesin
MKKLFCLIPLFFSFLYLNAQILDFGLSKYSFNSTVSAIVKGADGSTYIGGNFTQVALWSGNGVYFDGSSGVQNTDYVKVVGNIWKVVSIPSGGWFIGGYFTSINGEPRNGLARINADGSLHAFNPNMNNGVFALALDGSGNLYAGGDFTTVGDNTTRNRLCKFDNMGVLDATFNPNMNALVNTLAVDGSGNLYAGGSFTTVGGSTTRNRLCKFDNTGVLTSFDPNMNASVNTLALDGSGNLYAGGDFTTVGGNTTRNRLCKFDNAGVLTGFDPNMNVSVNTLLLDGSGSLYAGGSFTTVGGSTSRIRLCKFNNVGVLDATFNPNMNASVYTLALDGSGNLYAGGDFTTVGGSTTRNRLCKFDNMGALTSFDPNMSSRVTTLALDGSGNLYAGGQFRTIGGSTSRNYLCKLDPSGVLTSFDPNMNSTVYTLALDGSGNLYAGGNFTTVGGNTTRNRLCKFDNAGVLDATFNPNMNGIVRTLVVDGSGSLYAGGSFRTIGGSTSRNYLCKFDPEGDLTSFNPNMNSIVFTLVVDGSGNLYAGGAFTTVGGNTTRYRLCKFDPEGELTSFNPNMSDQVHALAVDASRNLYAGGDFTTVGGNSTRNRLCKFDNAGVLTSFNPNMIGKVSTLALDGSGNLYAGGQFTSAGGTPRNRLCKFDNTGVLTSFNPNLNSIVQVLALDGSGNLCVGGSFTSPSPFVAFYSTCIQPTVISSTPAARCGSGSVTLSATASEGANIKWYTELGSEIALEDDATYDLSGNDLIINNLTTTTTFYAEAVNGNCLSSLRTPVTATVNVIPSAAVNQSEDILFAVENDATTYEWLDCNNGDAVVGTSQLFTATQDGDYKLRITKNGCTNTASSCINAVIPISEISSNLDVTFDTDGMATTAFSSTNQVARTVQFLADGSSIVAGDRWNATTSRRELAVVKYLENGSLDPSFGTGGKFTLDLGDNLSVRRMEINASNEIFIAGSAQELGSDDVKGIVVKMTNAGALASSFGTSGVLRYGNAVKNTIFNDIKLESTNLILVGMQEDVTHVSFPPTPEARMIMIKVDNTGALVNGFGTSGRVELSLDNTGTAEQFMEVELNGSGEIVVSGITATGNVLIVKYTSEGSLDPTFSGDGRFDFSLENGDLFPSTLSMSLSPQNDIILAGSGFDYNTFSQKVYVAKVLSNATLDPAFDTDGKLIYESPTNATVEQVKVASNGKILLAGGDDSKFSLTRLSANGTFDTSFGTDGVSLTTIGTTDQAFDMAISSTGKVMLVGSATISGDEQFAAIRYGSNCTAPTVISTEAGDRCGAGSINLEASASEGTIRWYDALSGGNLVGIGSTWTTPSNSSLTKTYWAEALNDACLSSSRTAVVAEIFNCTKLINKDCGNIGLKFDDIITFYKINSATNYQVKVNIGDNYEFILDRTAIQNKFRINNIPRRSYATTYRISVRYSTDNGVSWKPWGEECTIQTSTKLIVSDCGKTNVVLDDIINFFKIEGVTNYQVRTDINGESQFILNRTAVQNKFRINNIQPRLNGRTYNVSIRYSNDYGITWSAWGETCTVTTAPLGMKQQNTDELTFLENDLILETYPNPNDGNFTISSSHEGTFNIINELGQLIQKIEITKENNFQAKVENLRQGVYFVTGTINNEVITKKIVVQ